MLKHNSIVSNIRWHNVFLVLCITAMAFFLNGCAKATEYKSEHDCGTIAINSVDDFFNLPVLKEGMSPDKVAKYYEDFCYYPSEYDGERIVKYEAHIPLDLSDSMLKYIFPDKIIIKFNADKELSSYTAEHSGGMDYISIWDYAYDDVDSPNKLDYSTYIEICKMSHPEYRNGDDFLIYWEDTKELLLQYCKDHEIGYYERDSEDPYQFIVNKDMEPHNIRIDMEYKTGYYKCNYYLDIDFLNKQEK